MAWAPASYQDAGEVLKVRDQPQLREAGGGGDAGDSLGEAPAELECEPSSGGQCCGGCGDQDAVCLQCPAPPEERRVRLMIAYLGGQ